MVLPDGRVQFRTCHGRAGRAVVKKNGGTVVGAARFAPDTTDFAPLIIQAQSAGANTLGLASLGTTTTSIIKQVKEFGVDVKVVPFVMDVVDVDAAGLSSFGNVSGVISFYWDLLGSERPDARLVRALQEAIWPLSQLFQ
jgi:branched-chain amino acid transport system substrate-binding protein